MPTCAAIATELSSHLRISVTMDTVVTFLYLVELL